MSEPPKWVHDVRKAGAALVCVRCEQPLTEKMLMTPCAGRGTVLNLALGRLRRALRRDEDDKEPS